MRRVISKSKKCKLCNSMFAEESVFGNPYKYCPVCRDKEWAKVQKMAKEYKK